MKTNKIIINVNSLEEIEKYKKIGITNFLFAIEEFSVGYKTFSLESLKKIDANIYLLINRMLDTEAINNFKKIINQLTFVKGIFFEDIGVFQTQFGTNFLSLDFWASKCLSSVLSNSLTKEEILEILNKAKKPLVFNVFGKNMAMYSRRQLLTNFNKHFKLEPLKEAIIEEKVTKKRFDVIENNYGTVMFYNTYFNYFSLLKQIDDSKILFYLINNQDLSFEEIQQVLSGNFKKSDIGFLEHKTIFKVGDENA